MKVLISGVCGFAGSHIARYLIETCKDVSVVGLDNLARPGIETNRLPIRQYHVQLFHGDLRLASDVEALPNVDWVINAAAQPSVLAGRDGKTSPWKLLEHKADGSARPYDVPWLVLGTTRATPSLGWKPDIELDQILEEIADHASNNLDWLERCGA